MFLDVDEKDIGQIGGGQRKPNAQLDVAMMQSLVRKEESTISLEPMVTSSSMNATTCPHSPSSVFCRR